MVKPRRKSTLPHKRRKWQTKGKLLSISKLKKELEKLQKQVVIKLYGTDCYTCPQTHLVGANCQLGHVPWPRSELSTECKYDHRFTRIQCFRCNIHCGGNGAKALQRMMREGIDVDELEALNFNTKGKVVPRKSFEEKIKQYTMILENMEG